jgi:hypothetical protein
MALRPVSHHHIKLPSGHVFLLRLSRSSSLALDLMLCDGLQSWKGSLDEGSLKPPKRGMG